MPKTAPKKPAWRQPINLLLALHFTLVLGFDYIDAGLRLSLAGVVACGYAILAIRAALSKSGTREKSLLLATLLIILAWFLGYLFVPGIAVNPNVGIESALRNIAPFLAAIALLGNRTKLSPMLLLVGCALILLSAIFQAVTMPPVYLNGSPRLAPFSAGLHTSAYTLALAALLTHELCRQKSVRWIFAVPIILTAAFMIIGYGVRTVYLLIALFLTMEVIGWWLRKARADATHLIIILAFLFAAGAITLLFIAISWTFEDLSALTSGRLSNYAERFELIFDRALPAFLFGTGPGSDALVTQTWWWDAKDAHNDFIHLLWEGGVLALLAALGFLAMLLWQNPRHLAAPVFVLIVTSAASNALLARPNVAFLMFCLMALRAAYGASRYHKPTSPAAISTRSASANRTGQ